MQIHDEIIRGETYYREIPLYTDEAKTQVLDWAGRTPWGASITPWTGCANRAMAEMDKGEA